MIVRTRTRIGREGTAAVEMAIVLPLLLVLVLGGIDFGFQLHVLHTMAQAAREAVRELAVRGGTLERAESVAQAQLSGIHAHFTVTPTWPGEGETTVTVRISVPREEISLGVDRLLGLSPAPTLQVRAAMRQEQ